MPAHPITIQTRTRRPAGAVGPLIAGLLALALANWAGAEPLTLTPVSIAPEQRVTPNGLAIQASSALVVDDTGRVLFARGARHPQPIASITKLMTALVILDAGLSLEDTLTIEESDRDTMRHSRSRLRIDRGAMLTRGQMLTVALVSSDNRAASALGRTAFPGGKPAFVAAMNRKAAALGMTESHFADPTGLDAGNTSTAVDLLKLLRAAARYAMIREITSTYATQVQPYWLVDGDPSVLEYRNTNPLVQNPQWQVEVSKTGYINEAGHCLVMRARVEDRMLDIVLLNAPGKRTPAADASRVKEWLHAQESSSTQLAQAKPFECAALRKRGCWE